jgi:translation initiation factor IF-1
MSKEEYAELEGVVLKPLPGGKFLIKLNGHENQEIIAHLSGKMRMNKINLLMGDKITVEVSPYDPTQGRITYRYK